MSTSSKYFHIVLTFDDKYVPWAMVTLQSLVLNCKTPYIYANNGFRTPVKYKICIFHTDVTDVNQNKIQQLVTKNDLIEIQFYNLNDLNDFNINDYYNNADYITAATYFRLEIPRLLEHEADHCLYIDCDIVVAMDPIKFLDIDLGNHIFAGVQDFWIDHLIEAELNPGKEIDYSKYIAKTDDLPYIEKSELEIDKIKQDNGDNFSLNYYQYILQFKNRRTYINAGVLYINLAKIRELKISNVISNAMSIIPKPIFRDQDLINYLANKFGTGPLLIDQKDWTIFQHNRVELINKRFNKFIRAFSKKIQTRSK